MNNGFLTEYYILAADGTELSEQEASTTAAGSESVDVTPVETIILGIGTVFVGLISIIIICAITGYLCNLGKKDAADETPAAPPANANVSTAPAAVSKEIEVNRGELAAVIAAAIAEETNTDIAGIKILSIKRV